MQGTSIFSGKYFVKYCTGKVHMIQSLFENKFATIREVFLDSTGSPKKSQSSLAFSPKYKTVGIHHDFTRFNYITTTLTSDTDLLVLSLNLQNIRVEGI